MVYRCALLLTTVILFLFGSLHDPATQAVAVSRAQATAKDNQSLVPGIPVAGELAAGETHSFMIAVKAGQFIMLVVAPMDVSTLLTVYGPNSAKIVESRKRYFGPTPISLLTNQTGIHRVEIALRVFTDAPVHYEIRLDQQRDPSPQDQVRIIAETAVREAGIAKSDVEAIQKLERALQLWRELGDQREEAYALTRVCDAHYYLDQHHLMLQRGKEALEIWQSLDDAAGQAETFFMLALAKSETGQIEAALNDYLASINLWRSAKVEAGLARCEIALGVLYSWGGDHQTAINLGTEALDIYRRLRNKTGETSALTLLGSTYYKVGYYQNAADIAHRTLQLAEESNNPLQKKLAHGLLGQSLLNQNELKLALSEFNEELALHADGKDFRAKAYTLDRLGQVYEGLGDWAKASAYYQQALAMHHQIGNPQGESGTLNRMGWLMEKGGQRTAALDYYNQALPLSRSAGDRSVQISALRNLARVQRDLGQLNEAGENVERAIALIESTRQRTGGRGQRSSYLAVVQEAYNLRVDLLMRQRERQLAVSAAEEAAKLNLAALQASDQARARTLLESLTEAQAGILKDVPRALLDREEELQRRMNVKDEERMGLFNGVSKRPEAERQQIAKKIDEELRALNATYNDLQGQILQAVPRYAELSQPPALSGDQIKTLLDEETMLLVYSLGDQRSYLWAVTPDSLESYPLPPRRQIEDKAREVIRWMAAQETSDKEPLEQAVQKSRQAEERYWREAAGLSQMLLGPVAALLDQKPQKRLLVVGEGALQRISFAALPEPGRLTDQEPRRREIGEGRGRGTQMTNARPYPAVSPSTDLPIPLVASHQVVYLPSISVLAAIRKDRATREPAPKMLALYADPIFSKNDGRVAANSSLSNQRDKGVAAPASEYLQQSLREMGLSGAEFGFQRLYGTKIEADYITPFVEPNSRFVAMGADASVESVKNIDLAQYRMIHFATHGLLNNENPELSGLVLSLFDARGQRQNGFLRMHEIYNLKLKADVVVLSSCESGAGKEVGGEGLMALTRGFFYAGAPRVVASLWTADDIATSVLMREFYQQLIEKHATPAAALKAAQLAVRGRRQWQAPYYWAGFVLQGECK